MYQFTKKAVVIIPKTVQVDPMTGQITMPGCLDYSEPEPTIVEEKMLPPPPKLVRSERITIPPRRPTRIRKVPSLISAGFAGPPTVPGEVGELVADPSSKNFGTCVLLNYVGQ